MEQTKKSNKLKIIIPVIIVILAIAGIIVGIVVAGGSKDTKEAGTGNTEQQQTSKENKEMTKEEMLAQATKLDAKAYAKELADNNAAADKKYADKVVSITGQVSSITSFLSECTIVFPNTNLQIVVKLSEDDLLQVKTGKNITVVGKGLEAHGFTTISDMDKAYLVSVDK